MVGFRLTFVTRTEPNSPLRLCRHSTSAWGSVAWEKRTEERKVWSDRPNNDLCFDQTNQMSEVLCSPSTEGHG